MKKSNIYTKTGDSGETGLVSGKRTSKADPRIDLYGELDDLNSKIGFASSLLSKDKNFKKIVERLHDIQSAIFDLGSNLACEYENRAKYNLPQLNEAFIALIEFEIDQMDEELPSLKNFILPGGSMESSAIHLCRTSARNVERKLIFYHNSTKEELPDWSVEFLNRLSDYFFVLARFICKDQGISETIWKARS